MVVAVQGGGWRSRVAAPHDVRHLPPGPWGTYRRPAVARSAPTVGGLVGDGGAGALPGVASARLGVAGLWASPWKRGSLRRSAPLPSCPAQRGSVSLGRCGRYTSHRRYAGRHPVDARDASGERQSGSASRITVTAGGPVCTTSRSDIGVSTSRAQVGSATTGVPGMQSARPGVLTVTLCRRGGRAGKFVHCSLRAFERGLRNGRRHRGGFSFVVAPPAPGPAPARLGHMQPGRRQVIPVPAARRPRRRLIPGRRAGYHPAG